MDKDKDVMMSVIGKAKSDSTSGHGFTSEFTTQSSMFGPTLIQYKGQVVRYSTDTPVYSLWSLFATSNTILQSRRTWVQVFYMTCVATISFVIVHFGGWSHSIRVVDLATEVRVLVSFVLGGYILECVARWSRTCEHLMTVTNELTKLMNIVDISPTESVNGQTRAKFLHYCRILVQMLFFTGGRNSDLSELRVEGLLSEEENRLLDTIPLGFRSDVICGWLDQMLLKHNLHEKCTDLVHTVRSSSRILADTHYMQLPFMYAHSVYWALQFIFMALACQSGITMAIFRATKESGGGQFDDDVGPDNAQVWLSNASFAMIVAKIIFILFANGMLHVCERIQNPLDNRTSSLSRHLHDDILVASCNCYRDAVKRY